MACTWSIASTKRVQRDKSLCSYCTVVGEGGKKWGEMFEAFASGPAEHSGVPKFSRGAEKTP